MIRSAPSALLGASLLALALLSGCPQPSSPAAGNTIELDSANDIDGAAEAFVRSGGKDSDLLLKPKDPTLAALSRTTPVGFDPALVKAVTVGRSMWRGPGQRAELQAHVFTFKRTLKGTEISGTAIYLDQPLTVTLQDGSTRQLVVSFRPQQGEWLIVPPPPAQPPAGAGATSPSPAATPAK